VEDALAVWASLTFGLASIADDQVALKGAEVGDFFLARGMRRFLGNNR
jgi:hypothetical protein